MANQSLENIRKDRLDKLEKLKLLGVNPYPSKYSRPRVPIAMTRDQMGREVSAVGRLWSLREHGNIVFADLKDSSGKIQLFFQRNNLKDSFGILKALDAGDFIGVSGTVIKTDAGETTIDVTSFEVLGKSLRPMPNSWEGLKDTEIRYRKRYLDMNINPEVYQRFLRRSRFWDAHREFFKKNGFVEINIPVLEQIPGCGDAKPFVTHMDAIDQDFYLRISQELYLKRLIGGGYEKVYEIGPRFRNEGLSDEHLPEHIAMECYWAYADWKDGMKFIHDMFDFVIKVVYGDKKVFDIRGFKVDFGKEWELIDFGQVMKKKYDLDVYNTPLSKLVEALSQQRILFEPNINVPRAVDLLWKNIRKDIAGPAWLINHPKFLSPLQKPNIANPDMVERIQWIVAGSELGNGWSEVNDPIDQFERFSEQQRLRDAGDQEAQWLDTDYVEMLEYGMPPTFGWGSSERVFWFLENVSAREGVPFPQLRSEVNTKAKQDFSQKMVIVIDQDLPSWQVMNTSGHLAAFLGNKMKAPFDTGKFFLTKDEVPLPRNSQYAVITLSAKKVELKKLLADVQKSGLLYLAYIPEMMQTTDDKKLENIVKLKDLDDIEVVGVSIFGPVEKVEQLTSKFTLWGGGK